MCCHYRAPLRRNSNKGKKWKEKEKEASRFSPGSRYGWVIKNRCISASKLSGPFPLLTGISGRSLPLCWSDTARGEMKTNCSWYLSYSDWSLHLALGRSITSGQRPMGKNLVTWLFLFDWLQRTHPDVPLKHHSSFLSRNALCDKFNSLREHKEYGQPADLT